MSAGRGDNWDAYANYQIERMTGDVLAPLDTVLIDRLLDDGLAMHIALAHMADILAVPV